MGHGGKCIGRTGGCEVAQNGRLVVGGASGPDYQRQMMDLAWLADTVEQCQAARVPLFVKQDSAMRPGDRGRIPEELWVRAYPKTSAHSSASRLRLT